jgi:hypothetical protein
MVLRALWPATIWPRICASDGRRSQVPLVFGFGCYFAINLLYLWSLRQHARALLPQRQRLLLGFTRSPYRRKQPLLLPGGFAARPDQSL